MDAYPVTDLTAYLSGRWRLDREIVAASGEPLGRFDGTCDFFAEGAEIVQRERGVLDFGAHHGEATRELRFRLTGPGTADVHFDHGGFFHAVDLTSGTWLASHPCAEDLYRVEYRVLGADHWRHEWTVRGPSKDHVIFSAFRRDQGVPTTG